MLKRHTDEDRKKEEVVKDREWHIRNAAQDRIIKEIYKISDVRSFCYKLYKIAMIPFSILIAFSVMASILLIMANYTDNYESLGIKGQIIIPLTICLTLITLVAMAMLKMEIRSLNGRIYDRIKLPIMYERRYEFDTILNHKSKKFDLVKNLFDDYS